MISFLCKKEHLDEDQLFALPVVEMYPELASRYLRVVQVPMDFRTIIEMKIHHYNEISELQDDLILVFKNCCLFNGEKNEYWHYAM